MKNFKGPDASGVFVATSATTRFRTDVSQDTKIAQEFIIKNHAFTALFVGLFVFNVVCH